MERLEEKKDTKDLDSRIEEAMKKIIHDTIGDTEPEPEKPKAEEPKVEKEKPEKPKEEEPKSEKPKVEEEKPEVVSPKEPSVKKAESKQAEPKQVESQHIKPKQVESQQISKEPELVAVEEKVGKLAAFSAARKSAKAKRAEKREAIKIAAQTSVEPNPDREVIEFQGVKQSMSEAEKSKLKKRIAYAALGIVAAIGIGFYGYYTYYYSDKFFPNTSINGIQCAGMTAEETEALIRERVEDYSITLTFRGGETSVLDGNDFDYSYVSDGQAEKIQDSQISLLWFTGYLKKRNFKVGENITYDKKALKEELLSVPCMKKKNMQDPVNAYYTFTDGKFTIVAEDEGTKIDRKALFADIKEAVSESRTEFDVEEAGVYAEPEIRSTNATLKSEVDELNGIMTASITYQLPTGPEVLDGNTLVSWLAKDEAGHYVKDETTIRNYATAYIDDMKARVDTVGAERPFTTASGVETTVSGGDYGWEIDRSSEIETLIQNVLNNDQIEREPIYTSREFTTENNGFGNTYIEVNLSEQHLYYFKDGEIIIDTPFVSGKMTESRYTPAGIYTLTYKETDRLLRGTPLGDGSYSYTSHVNFWMPFNGGVGLHDASWRDEFGGTIYRYSGSHGCINLPYSAASQIYSEIDKQTPIICLYYPGDFSLITDYSYDDDDDDDGEESSSDDYDEDSYDDDDYDDDDYDDSYDDNDYDDED